MNTTVRSDQLWSRFQVRGAQPPIGWADVFNATNRRDLQPVQIWLLHLDSSKQAFSQSDLGTQLELASAFEHPNAAPLLEYGEHAGRLFLVYKASDAPTAEHILGESAPLPASTVAPVLAEIAAGLTAAADRHIQHPGLSPRLLTINDQGRPQIFGLGLPHLATTGTDRFGGPDSGDFISAPELEPGEPASQPSQAFAIGCLAQWFVTGSPPWSATSRGELDIQKRTSPPRPLDLKDVDIPWEFQMVVDRALSKDLGERQETLRELQAELAKSVPAEPGDDAHQTAAIPTLDSSTVQLAVPEPVSYRRSARPPVPKARRKFSKPLLAGVAAVFAVGCAFVALVPANANYQKSSATPTVAALAVTTPFSLPTPDNSETAQLIRVVDSCWDRDWSCSVGNLEAVVNRDPANPEYKQKLTIAYFRLGSQYVRGGQLNAGLEMLNKGLANDPTDRKAIAERNLAAAYLGGANAYDAGRWGEAAEDFEAVISVEPEFLNAKSLAYASHVNEGLRLIDLGRRTEAKAECDRALFLKPDGREAIACIADLQRASAPVAPVASRPGGGGSGGGPPSAGPPEQTPTPAITATVTPSATPIPPTPTATVKKLAPCLVSSLKSTSQSNNGYVQIRGVVRDKYGRPVAGARIELETGGPMLKTSTDPFGSYAYEVLGRGIYLVRVVSNVGPAEAFRVDASKEDGPPSIYQVDWNESGCP